MRRRATSFSRKRTSGGTARREGVRASDLEDRPGIFSKVSGFFTAIGAIFGVGGEKVDSLATRGESAAALFLRRAGYRILERNYLCEVGEVDIIARQGRTLVFVEVKTRESDDVLPEQQVNQAKQHHITKAAKVYLKRFGTPQPPARFDVVAILWPPGRQPQISHIENAFEATF